MQIQSTTKYARISAFKAREVAREIQGLPVAAALDLVAFSPKKAAVLIAKTLLSTLIEAGKDLYHGPLRTFLSVTLPATRAGMLGGLLLVFLPALGDFVSAQLLGGPSTYMIGNLIQQQFFEGQNAPLGSALTVVLMLALIIFMVFYLRATDRERRET